jgi:hypothetical protein
LTEWLANSGGVAAMPQRRNAVEPLAREPLAREPLAHEPLAPEPDTDGVIRRSRCATRRARYLDHAMSPPTFFTKALVDITISL